MLSQETKVENLDEETVHLLECLSRDILKRPLIKRQNFLARFEKLHGEKVTDILKLYISKEFNKRVAARNKSLDAAARLRNKK